MNTYDIMPEDEFQSRFPEIHDQVCKELGIGFVPEIFRAVVNANPALAQSSWNMVRVNLCAGDIPRITKEILFSYVANQRKCDYCDIAHQALAIHHGCDIPDIPDMFKDINAIRNPPLRAVIQYTDAAITNDYVKQSLLEDDLIGFGFSKEEILELIGMISCAMYMVNIASSIRVTPDRRFNDVVNEHAQMA